MSQTDLAHPQTSGSTPFGSTPFGSTGFYSTAAGLEHQRLLHEHAEPLRAYLFGRLRNEQKVIDAFYDICLWLNRQSQAELKRAPTHRAAFYRATRGMALSQIEADGGQIGDVSEIPWEAAAREPFAGYAKVVDHVRFGLGDSDLEILELRYARKLSIDEVSYVLDTSQEDVISWLDAGRAWTEVLVREVHPQGFFSTAQVIHDAYQLVPAALRKADFGPKRPPPQLAVDTVIGSRYRVSSCIGGGAFAWVYRAHDIQVPGHVVAIKVLHQPARTPASREGAMRELSLIASAFHPSLVQFKDHGWFQERLWFVMPWYHGTTLLEHIERAPMDVFEACRMFAPLARALSAMHAAGVVHQDVKPANIFVAELNSPDQSNRSDEHEHLPVLLDLGVAAPEGDLAIAGTPLYFAPEMAQRMQDAGVSVPITGKVDVFALALSFIHSIEGIPELNEEEWAREDRGAVEAFLEHRAASSPSVPNSRALKPLRPLLSRCLSKDPDARPSADELARELSEALKRRSSFWERGGPLRLRGLRKTGSGQRQGRASLLMSASWALLVCGALALGASFLGVEQATRAIQSLPKMGHQLSGDPRVSQCTHRAQPFREESARQQARAAKLERTLETMRRECAPSTSARIISRQPR